MCLTTGCNHTPLLKHHTLKQWRVLWKGLEDSLIRCTEKGFNGPVLRCVQWVLMRQITLKNELVSGVLFGLFLGNLSPVFQQVQKQVRFSTHAFPSAGVFLCRRKEKGGEGLLKHAGWLPIIKGAKQGKFQSSLKWWAEELYIPSKITIWLWEERWARVKYCRWALMWHRCTSRSMRKPCLLWEEVSRVNAHTCSHTWDRKRERKTEQKKSKERR